MDGKEGEGNGGIVYLDTNKREGNGRKEIKGRNSHFKQSKTFQNEKDLEGKHTHLPCPSPPLRSPPLPFPSLPSKTLSKHSVKF